MADDAPRKRRRDDDDGWADAPDRFARADREWASKWSTNEEEPLDAPDGGYRNEKVTAGRVNDAYGDGMREAGPHLGFGLQIGVAMVVFVAAGIGVDRWLGIAPWGTILGAVLGMVGVMALVLRMANESDTKR